ncbi:hypothetical protein AHF37_04809 [Paragonimus kellicotti]|nr:hypothetical protein AHF37_04809 [Paragonimus kellicotti]
MFPWAVRLSLFSSLSLLNCQLIQYRDLSLASLRSLVVVAEERPRVQLTATFTKLFAGFGLVSRAVSTSFGCRVNLAMCLQGASSPESTTVYVDRISLRNDRIKLLEKGSPHSLCLMESGKVCRTLDNDRCFIRMGFRACVLAPVLRRSWQLCCSEFLNGFMISRSMQIVYTDKLIGMQPVL